MFSDPDKNVGQFALDERMTVVDLGAGSGAYTIAAAKRVRQFGKVYAVEVQKELTARLKNIATKEGLSNVEVVWGDIEKIGGTRLGDNVADAVIFSNILFQVEDKVGTLSEIKRILKPGGKVLVVDWSDSFGGMGPAPKDIIPASVAEELFSENGFKIGKEIETGAHHYGFIAEYSGSVEASRT